MVPAARIAPKVRLARPGASEEMTGMVDDDPTCMHTTLPVSWAAAMTGSQYRFGSWIVGSPSGSGFSENAKAVAPLAAHRSISLAAAGGSHRGIIIRGMKRPGTVPHHSSIIQSL